MADLKFTHKSVDDLASIWNYTFNTWSATQADHYYNMLLENCKDLAKKPELGKQYLGIAKGLRGFKAGRHLIFYRIIENNCIEITRILHEQMDIKTRLSEK
jgi:toxin ParE1/3/4